MTFDALVAIIALGAGWLIIVMLAIAFPRMDDRTRRGRDSRSAESSSRRQVTIRRSGPMRTLRDAPSRRAMRKARTTRARKPRRPAWHGIANVSTAWRHKLSSDLLYLRARARRVSTAWRHKLSSDLLYLRARARRWERRRGLNEGEAAWIAATLALSVALVYLIAQI